MLFAQACSLFLRNLHFNNTFHLSWQVENFSQNGTKIILPVVLHDDHTSSSLSLWALKQLYLFQIIETDTSPTKKASIYAFIQKSSEIACLKHLLHSPSSKNLEFANFKVLRFCDSSQKQGQTP